MAVWRRCQDRCATSDRTEFLAAVDYMKRARAETAQILDPASLDWMGK
jgi:hypothetical protein